MLPVTSELRRLLSCVCLNVRPKWMGPTPVTGFHATNLHKLKTLWFCNGAVICPQRTLTLCDSWDRLQPHCDP
ncbi:hypothetical protein AMECASPLE_021052 [Ameca splendens]|uniref:Sushi domain-containing protein n=1 Tax=Ameca splendens TaxID=208324 RepID=A0ABV0ZCR9_9TELE